MRPEEAPRAGLVRWFLGKVLSLDSLLLVGLRTLSKFLLLIFVLLCARSLGQADFGDFQFVDTLTVQVLQLLVVVSMVVTRVGCCFPEADLAAHLRWFHRRAHGRMLLAALALAGLGALIDAPMRQAFSVAAPGCFAAAGATVGAYMLFCYYMGLLQALERFRAIGALFLAMGLVSLLLGAALFTGALGGLGVFQACAAITAGTLAATLGGLALVRRALPRGRALAPPRLPSLGFAWVYLAAIGLFLLMHNLDIWVTKFLLDRSEAGYYARFEFVGKIIFMISSSLTIILFPKVGKAHERGADPRHYLTRVLAGFGLLTAAFAALVLGLFDVISPAMFGQDLSAGLGVLALVILAKAAQSLVFILINYEAARARGGMLGWLGAGLVLEAALAAVLGVRPLTMALAAAVAAVLSAAALFRQVWKNVPPPAEGAPTPSPGPGPARRPS